MGYLPTFLAVCDHGGFHRASQVLNLTQPAVSYQIRTLERLLGVELFARSGRGVTLTRRGALLRDYCQRAVADFETLRRDLLAGLLSVNPTLKIASVSAFGRYVVFPVLRDSFRSARLELRFPSQDDVLRLVSAGFVDTGFIYEQRSSSAIVSVHVATEELVMIGRKRARNPRGLKDIAGEPFVTWDEYEYVFGRWFDVAFGRQPGPLTSVAHFEEMEEVVEWVASSDGLSIVPFDCAAAAIREKRVHVWRSRGRKCLNQVYAIYRPDRMRDDVEALIDAIRRAASSR